jgi:hypothetical protein
MDKKGGAGPPKLMEDPFILEDGLPAAEGPFVINLLKHKV